MGYTTDRLWSDKYIPQIKKIIGPYLLEVSSYEVDTKEAADLVVLSGRNLTIACRIRRPGYEQFIGQFTLRAKRDNGSITELKKIIDGWGDWMFYGHINEDDKIHVWMLVDLKAFRAHMVRNRKVIESGFTANGDGTHFAWFDAMTFPPEPSLLIATNIMHPRVADRSNC